MKKILLILALSLLVISAYPVYEYITAPPLTEDIDIPQETPDLGFNDNSKIVLKVVHTLSKNGQIVTKTASAVLMYEDINYYYAVTNYHVTSKDGYLTDNVVIVDYLNVVHDAEIIQMNQAQEIIANLYDLAVIRFIKEHELPKPVIRENSLNTSTLLYAIGYPNGIRIARLGYYLSLTDVNGYQFQLIEHSANIEPGFSGGGLLDVNGKLVGINVSGLFDNNNQFVTGYAIPVSKVLEFINLF